VLWLCLLILLDTLYHLSHQPTPLSLSCILNNPRIPAYHLVIRTLIQPSLSSRSTSQVTDPILFVAESIKESDSTSSLTLFNRINRVRTTSSALLITRSFEEIPYIACQGSYCPLRSDRNQKDIHSSTTNIEPGDKCPTSACL
jgi:hypothetical protein